MERTTAQRFFISGAILALLGIGSCFLAINPPESPGGSGNESLGWVIVYGLFGIAALALAIILGTVSLIGWHGAKN
jgi:hypothetical protein